MLSKIKKFSSFSLPDQLIIAKAISILIFIRLGLKFLHLRTLRRQLAKIADIKVSDKPLSVYKVIWSITTASSYMPNIKCLARALAAQVLLEQQGYPATLRVGIAKDQQKIFAAHAWVECKGRVVIGGIGNSINKYHMMPIQEFEQLTVQK